MESLFKKLTDYAEKDRISFAMPGHKGGRGFSAEFKENIARLDVTELFDTENLKSPKCEIITAQKNLAERFGARESFILTGGSTEGVWAMLFSASKNGVVLTNRNCHRAVVNASIIAGFDLEFISQSEDENLAVPLPPTADEVRCLLEKNSNITACIITSPDYYGHIADIEGIAEVCHKYNIPLLTDEAHGAALYADGFSLGALKNGADMAVQSAHKTLNALNQAAYLHWNSDLISLDTVCDVVKMVGTSSPSYPIAVSAETALSGLSGNSWSGLADYLDEKRAELKSKSEILYPLGQTDRTRLVFGLLNYGISGYEIEKILRKSYNIDIEMSDRHNAVCIVTPSNTKEEIDLLFSAVLEILKNTEVRKNTLISEPPPAKRELSPKEAFFKKGESVKLSDSTGRISKTNISAYPPGTAIVLVGEEISAEAVDYILEIRKLGANIEGLHNNDNILVVG